jgi:hypothetical protein
MGVNSSKGFNFKLIASGSQLDLFQDETITVSNNVTGLFDIGILPSDFTRQITIPGTKTNNAFFKHVYDISVENPYLFATNVKVPAYFDFDGFYISQGYLQLNKVNVRANKFIESYEISIYGTLSSFSRDINKLFLTDLSNLSVYNHTASYQNIVDSWDGNLFDGDIVYPFAEYGTAWKFTSGDDFFGLDDSQGGITVQDFKPSIRVKKILDAIFEFTGYTYQSDFFNEAWWDEVYMICNNSLKYPEFSGVNLETYGVAKWGAISGSGMTDLIVPKNTQTNLPWYNRLNDPSSVVNANGEYTIPKSTALRGILNLEINLSGSLGGPALELNVYPTGSSTPVSSTPLNNFYTFFNNNTFASFANGDTGQSRTYTLQTEFNTQKIDPGTYNFGIEWSDIFTAPYNNFRFTLDPGGQPKSYIQIKKSLQAADGRIMDIQSNMPFGESGIKLVDFIKGLQKKFNLVIYPDNTKQNHFIIEPFNTWYNDGEIKSFDKYINLDEIIEVVPANNLAVNKLQFGDTLGNDYIAQQFQKENTREYAKTYYTDTENYFSQGEFKVETTFAVSPLSYLVGTGLSGSAEGITPPSGTTYAYYVGNAGFGSSYDACNNTSYFPNTLYSNVSPLVSGATLYTDSGLTNKFNGGYSIWKFVPAIGSQYQSIFISSTGVVGSPTLC